MKLWAGILDVLFPPRCLGCASVQMEAPFFCRLCEPQLETCGAGGCPSCGDAASPWAGGLCPRCKSSPPPFEAAHCPFLHSGAAARAVYRFKYEDSPELAPRLAQLLAEQASRYLERASGEVCAIPLHPSRRRKRRYDQSQLLAQALAKAQSRPFLAGALRRTLPTRPQVGLSLAEREQNVANVFWAHPSVAGKSLLLVDDVLTTSATARAAARALREKGAEKVYILAFARASLG